MSKQPKGYSASKYGNWIVGIWRCLECNFDCFPRLLSEQKAKLPFKCPKCQTVLTYDEEA